MDKKTALILGLLGAGPLAGTPQDAFAQEKEAYSVHERTAAIVSQMIASNALYASSDATKLLIRRSALSADMITGLESSKEVEISAPGGDFVVKPDFATALLKGRVIDGMLPKTIADFLMLQKLQRDAATGVPAELASYHSAPFF